MKFDLYCLFVRRSEFRELEVENNSEIRIGKTVQYFVFLMRLMPLGIFTNKHGSESV